VAGTLYDRCLFRLVVAYQRSEIKGYPTVSDIYRVFRNINKKGSGFPVAKPLAKPGFQPVKTTLHL
jgi:hypothetical protein